MWQVKNCQQKCMFVSLLQLVATHFIRLSIRSFASLLLKTFLHRHPKEFSRTTKPFVKQKIGMQKSLKGDKVHFEKSIVVTSGIWVTNTTQPIDIKCSLIILHKWISIFRYIATAFHNKHNTGVFIIFSKHIFPSIKLIQQAIKK